jgi:hypothetical protein
MELHKVIIYKTEMSKQVTKSVVRDVSDVGDRRRRERRPKGRCIEGAT